MLRPILLVALVAAGACSAELPAPGPGNPEDVRSIRLYDGAGVDQTEHVFLFRDDTLRLEVRLFAADGGQLTDVHGGVELSLTFAPESVAVSTPIPGQSLRRAVTTTAAAGTPGSLSVTLHFTAGGGDKTFGPFECLVH
jgi:hypothetical protein